MHFPFLQNIKHFLSFQFTFPISFPISPLSLLGVHCFRIFFDLIATLQQPFSFRLCIVLCLILRLNHIHLLFPFTHTQHAFQNFHPKLVQLIWIYPILPKPRPFQKNILPVPHHRPRQHPLPPGMGGCMGRRRPVQFRASPGFPLLLPRRRCRHQHRTQMHCLQP